MSVESLQWGCLCSTSLKESRISHESEALRIFDACKKFNKTFSWTLMEHTSNLQKEEDFSKSFLQTKLRNKSFVVTSEFSVCSLLKWNVKKNHKLSRCLLRPTCKWNTLHCFIYMPLNALHINYAIYCKRWGFTWIECSITNVLLLGKFLLLWAIPRYRKVDWVSKTLFYWTFTDQETCPQEKSIFRGFFISQKDVHP